MCGAGGKYLQQHERTLDRKFALHPHSSLEIRSKQMMGDQVMEVGHTNCLSRFSPCRETAGDNSEFFWDGGEISPFLFVCHHVCAPWRFFPCGFLISLQGKNIQECVRTIHPRWQTFGNRDAPLLLLQWHSESYLPSMLHVRINSRFLWIFQFRD